MINHNARYKVVTGDITTWPQQWATNDGFLFDACLGDWTYNLTTITERFGKPGAAPAKHGSDGQFARLSAGFMHEDWDTPIGYFPETWAGILPILKEGAWVAGYSHPRQADLMASAMRAGGCEIGQSFYNYKTDTVMQPPTQLAWAFATGSPRNTKADKVGPDFTDFVYGRSPVKPQLEPILLGQKPFGKRRLDSIEQGVGIINIPWGRQALGGPVNKDPDKKSIGRYPGHLSITHHPLCRHLGTRFKTSLEHRIEYHCHDDCIVKAYEQDGGRVEQLWQSDWQFEIAESLEYLNPIFFTPKPSKHEREAGLEMLEAVMQARLNAGGLSNEEKWSPKEKKNNHPTVKPIKSNIWLARLFLPPKSVGVRRILVPCSGSGSEMIGAILAGWDEVIGVEIDPDGRYQTIANMRLEFWTQAMRMFPASTCPFKLVDQILKKQNYEQILELIDFKAETYTQPSLFGS